MTKKVYEIKHSHHLLREASKGVSIPILRGIVRSNVLTTYLEGLSVEAIKEHDLEQVSGLTIDQLLLKIKSKTFDIEGPSEQWTDTRLPYPHQCTLGDDVKRIEYVYQRSKNVKVDITEEEFDELWTFMKNVAKRMDKYLEGTQETFVNKLAEIRHIKPFHKRSKRVSAPCLETIPEKECVQRYVGKHRLPRFSTHTGLQERDTEQRRRLQAYSVKLLYPPDDLSNYDYISNTLINVLNKSSSCQNLHSDAVMWKEDFILIAHSVASTQAFCLKHFNSECTAVRMKWKAMGEEGEILKCEDLTEGGTCRLIVVEILQQTDTKEIEFLMHILENHVQTCKLFFLVNEKRDANTELCNMKVKYPHLRINILEGNELDMTRAFYECLRLKLKASQKLLSKAINVPNRAEVVTKLETLESECHAQYRDISIPELLSKRLKRLRLFGVVAFTSKGEKVVAYVLDRDKERFETALKKLKIIQKSFSFLEWKSISDGIAIKEFLQPGDYITMQRQSKNVRGTLGIFGEGKNKSLMAVTGAHVIEEQEDVYFHTPENKLLKLGSCIYSPRSDDVYIANITDIGVIEVNESIADCLKRERLGLQVTVYEGDHKDLFRKRVFKYGGTTDKTEGFIVKTNFELELGKQMVCIMLVEEIKQSGVHFAKQGDSGSVVFCKRGPRSCDAVAIVFGGELTLPDIPPDWGVTVTLDKALKEYSNKMNDTLSIDRF